MMPRRSWLMILMRFSKNEDGTYTRCKLTEGEEPDFAGGTQMKFESGSDTIFTDTALEAPIQQMADLILNCMRMARLCLGHI